MVEWGKELVLRGDPDDVVHIRGYILFPGHHEIDGHMLLAHQDRKQLVELLACLGVKTDKGIVEYQDVRLCQERLDELELAQFATAQGDGVFVEQGLKLKQTDEVLQQQTSLGRVVAQHVVGTLNHLAHTGRLLVDIMLVPAQLQVIGTVGGCAVGVAEGDIAHLTARQVLAKLVHILRLATAVAAYDSYDFLAFHTLS